MKVRYLYAAILSAVLFLILLFALDFPIWFCIVLAIATYVGGIFFFKEKDVRKYDPNIIMHYCYLISKIDNYKRLIDDEKVDNNIEDITKKTEKIVVMLEQKPDKVTQIYDSFDYYLPFTIKILDQYVRLDNEENKKDEEKKFMNEINKTLDYIETEVDKLLENMNYTKMLDINSSIEMFRKQADKLEEKIDRKEDK